MSELLTLQQYGQAGFLTLDSDEHQRTITLVRELKKQLLVPASRNAVDGDSHHCYEACGQDHQFC